MDQGNKKLVNQVVIFIVVFAIAFLGTRYVMKQLKSKAPEEVKESNK